MTIYVAAATGSDGSRLRAPAEPDDGQGTAAAVAVLEFERGGEPVRKTIAERLDDCGPLAAALSAAALGVESLNRPCRVLVVSHSPELVWVMTGYVRSCAYADETRRLNRALRARDHEVSWSSPVTPEEGALCESAYAAARKAAGLGSTAPAANAEAPAPRDDGDAPDAPQAPPARRRLIGTICALARAAGLTRHARGR